MSHTENQNMEFRFVLSAYCNFDCYFCLNEYFPVKTKTIDLKPEDYGFLVKVGRRLGIQKVTLTGGEPLIRRDFAAILQAIRSQCRDCHITLVTNGSLLHRWINVLFMVDELHVSFHTFDKSEWTRITGTKSEYQTAVLENIRLVRKHHPSLEIKINVVSEKANNTPETIQKYIEFASDLDLQINVFKEGYLKIAKMLGMEREYIEPAPLWDLSPFSPSLIQEMPRKRIYLVKDVRIVLSMTSTDEMSWDSIWVTPTGLAYCNALHTTPAIDLLPSVRDEDSEKLTTCLISLVKEAHTSKSLHSADVLSDIVQLREASCPTVNIREVIAQQGGKNVGDI